MFKAWPIIKGAVPDTSLVITSDYRLWGSPDARNDQDRANFFGWKDVTFLGAVNRQRMVEEELKAEIHAYPCTYDELFCISIAETQVAGAYPISTDVGAMETTNLGKKVKYHKNADVWLPEFCDFTIEALKDPNLVWERKKIQEEAIERFDPYRILKEWDEKVFSG